MQPATIPTVDACCLFGFCWWVWTGCLDVLIDVRLLFSGCVRVLSRWPVAGKSSEIAQ